jgi:predicted DNA-binding transcriptional regulator AlpA
MENPLRKLLTFRELKQLGIPYSRTTIWFKVRQGTFPKPVKIGANRNV